MKKANTLMNFVMLIGLIIVGFVVITNLTSTFYQHTDKLEEDKAASIAEDIISVIEKAQAYPNDVRFMVQLATAEDYIVNVSQNTFTMLFPKEDYIFTKKFFMPGTHLVPSHFSHSGTLFVLKTNKNLLITDALHCNLTDDICDPGCIIDSVCDPECYHEEYADLCNPYCVDQNDNLLMEDDDRDEVCDPDCYNAVLNGGFYDVDCIKENDSICDPDTHNNRDGICDADCLGTNGICDPDCKEQDRDCPHAGNSLCETDRGEDCFHTASDCPCTNNAACRADCTQLSINESGCIALTEMKGEAEVCTDNCECQTNNCVEGHCCPVGEDYNGTGCISPGENNVCEPEYGEHCGNNGACACPDAAACCPEADDHYGSGCVEKQVLAEAEPCSCDDECTGDMHCDNSHCCPEDLDWNTDLAMCEEKNRFRIVVVPINYRFPSQRAVYEQQAQGFFDYWITKGPFKKCPGRAELLLLDEDCSTAISRCYQKLCSSGCYNTIIQCARNQYGAEFDKAEALYYGSADMYITINGVIGKVLGCSGNSNLGVPPYLGSRYGGAVHETSQGNIRGQGSTHELGHDFGLCHDNCLDSRPDKAWGGSCPNNDPCDNNAIMAYGPKIYFAPGSYNHLENHPYLETYLEACK